MWYSQEIPGYLVNLTGVNNVIGRAVIIHANEDTCGQPSGGAGARLAQCVIGLGDPINSAPPTTDGDTDQGNSPEKFCLGSSSMQVPSMLVMMVALVWMALLMQ